MISRTSEIPDLNKYAIKMSENDCFVDLQGGKLCLSYLLAVISEKMFASCVFPDKNQKPLRRCRMQITKQAVVILSQISGNDLVFHISENGSEIGKHIIISKTCYLYISQKLCFNFTGYQF